MSSNLFLNGSALFISLFNTILLIWLGLTVLLNAERHSLGVSLAGGGLLAGGIFFLGHSIILASGVSVIAASMELWWFTGWILVIGLPFLWYLVILWYAGYGGINSRSFLPKRHLGWFIGLILLLISLFALLMSHTVPSFFQARQQGLADFPWARIFLLVFLYSLYIFLCIGLAMHTLRFPVSSPRMMGDRARQRARPWLMASSLTLLMVSLLVCAILIWLVWFIGRQGASLQAFQIDETVAWFDLAIAFFIGIAVVLMGQAIVSYEIFTGKILPRRGLFRFWRRMLLLSAGYSLLVAWSLVLDSRPVFPSLLGILVLTIFFALLSWRLYAEREYLMQQLRPFLASQQLYDQIIHEGDTISRQDGQFIALCDHVLGIEKAILIPGGNLASIIRDALIYPPNQAESMDEQKRSEILQQAYLPASKGTPLDPSTTNGYVWSLPLWNAHGLAGMLVLGEKRNKELYSQEDMEIAQAAGERILDTLASLELSHRLVDLPRRQMVESQIFDRRLRRELHDEILPHLHNTILLVDALDGFEKESTTSRILEELTDLHRQISNTLRGIPARRTLEISQTGLAGMLRQVVESEYEGCFDEVEWQVEPETKDILRDLSPVEEEVLYYAAREAIRNAARYAEKGHPLHLQVSLAYRDGLQVHIQENGCGFLPGKPDRAGSGTGLMLHSTLMAIIGGTLQVESLPGKYTRVTLELLTNQRKLKEKSVF